jgi:hypothetical protein
MSRARYRDRIVADPQKQLRTCFGKETQPNVLPDFDTGPPRFSVRSSHRHGQDYDIAINNGYVIDPAIEFDAIAHRGFSSDMIVPSSDTPLAAARMLKCARTNSSVAGERVLKHSQRGDLFKVSTAMGRKDGLLD